MLAGPGGGAGLARDGQGGAPRQHGPGRMAQRRLPNAPSAELSPAPPRGRDGGAARRAWKTAPRRPARRWKALRSRRGRLDAPLRGFMRNFGRPKWARKEW
eukprot:9497151-Pyramimonas_sp.AAC.1